MTCIDKKAFAANPLPEAIDALSPIVDLLDSMSAALECDRFDSVSMREGICVALGMTSQRLEAVIEALYESKKADHVH